MGDDCPRCGREALGWDHQDDLEFAGAWFVERRLVCEVGGCWAGPPVLFRGTKPDWAKSRDGELPDDPSDGAAPMQPPCP